MAKISENLHWKSVYDCSTYLGKCLFIRVSKIGKCLFIRVSKKGKVNDCITNIKNVNTCVFSNSLWNKGKLATG